MLEEISDSVPYKEEIRLQLIEIKRPDSNDDTNNVLTTSDQRTNKGEGEGEGKGEGEGEEEGEGEAHSAPASPPRSFSDSFIPFPKSFAFPLKNGSVLTLEPETIDFWQARFPNIVVPARLHKHREWFLNNPHRRMNQKGTETALLKFLDQDNDEAIRNRSP
ncbi:MAG: hypothetical protein JXR49_17560 [Acidobacteria bacterium]|nr:hypothetical protein [Acidobacteriota bacterium]